MLTILVEDCFEEQVVELPDHLAVMERCRKRNEAAAFGSADEQEEYHMHAKHGFGKSSSGANRGFPTVSVTQADR